MPHASNSHLPVAVIGAGPTGLVAAVHLLARGFTPVVLERGPSVGSSVRSWSHVRVFSPWKHMVEPLSRGLLKSSGRSMPDAETLPTGGEFVRDFLEPLAAHPLVEPHVRFRHRVTAIARRSLDKVKSAGRDEAPFEVLARGPDGDEISFLAQAVIDASGTFEAPNPLGSGGLPVPGEAVFASQIRSGIPDVLGAERARYAGRRTVVVGSGHSAFNALLDLAWLKTEEPETRILWAVRRREIGLLFGGRERDGLPARGSLGSRLKKLVDLGVVEMFTGFRTSGLDGRDDGLHLIGVGDEIGPVDEVVAATGFRPDLAPLRELRLGLDPVLDSTPALALLIDPNVHSCGTVYPHGYRELGHPEKDFFMVGMKSYGRAPTFLLLTGYEQVRSVVSALAGDIEAAGRVELALPGTGVCSTDLAGAGAGSSCC